MNILNLKTEFENTLSHMCIGCTIRPIFKRKSRYCLPKVILLLLKRLDIYFIFRRHVSLHLHNKFDSSVISIKFSIKKSSTYLLNG